MQTVTAADSRMRLRALLALFLAAAMLAAGAPAIDAQDRDTDEPFSTDPSAEEAAGQLDTDERDAPSLRSQTLQAQVDEPDEIVVEDGLTQPVFSYEDAIRETVIIEGAVSSEDGDEVDMLTVDIIRPAASDGELQVPTIIVPSPYYQSPGRGRAGETKPPAVQNLLVAGDLAISGNLLSGSVPLGGETGVLVDCGLALSASDCPEETDGNIALVERGQITFNAKASNAVAAGAIAVVIYNSSPGGFSGNLGSGITVPVFGISGNDGAALLDAMAEGPVEAALDATVTDGIDFFPLYYDNYFVPRGYAVALLDLAGTRGSTGCLDIGGPAEIENSAKLVEWLNGTEDAVAHDVDGNEVDAHWSNGLSSMVGKSWDGTVANGVASLGVEGLATIVPITAISAWHKYYWENGVGYAGSPLGLANNIRNVPASRCQEVIAELAEGGSNPDPTTDFWMERDYIKDADQIEASVFVVHGLNDYNVKPHNYGKWWEVLEEHDVPRKIWLSQVAHEKAFDFRRDEWMVTINRWFDHWLQGIDNGIMDEPMADVEHAPNEWATYDTWPGGTPTPLHLGQPADHDDPRPGTLSTGRRNLKPQVQTFTETRQNRNSASSDGFTVRDDRLVFMTEELSEPVRVSGTAAGEVSLEVSIDGPDATFSAYLVDYGEAERTQHTVSGGIFDLQSVTCFGQGTAIDTGCYRDVVRRTHTEPFEVVARGWANASFVTGEEQFDPDERYRLEWEIFADDYTFEAGHRIGVVITGSDTTTRNPGTSSDITVHLPGSKVRLPIEGGPPALFRATGGPGGPPRGPR